MTNCNLQTEERLTKGQDQKSNLYDMYVCHSDVITIQSYKTDTRQPFWDGCSLLA